ncbi:DUF4145 domain-containing protein [Nitrosomonas ureae]|uniref:DUF4145 domain-containing protein n=1 Tax=Nitrosomonas ureae TaxID=44577 RepID=A0A1H5X6Q3_9PROT|nr:DUF4145 domain-containing protein [Nitrosomonas ureae]SEG07428.1 protein of unknown function [Nitrosomonas ureae]
MPEQKEKIQVHCGECKRHTNHTVLTQREVNAHPEDDFHWGEIHYFCQCAGCNCYCYAIAEFSEDDWNSYTREMDYRWKTYPRSKGERLPIDDVYELPNKVRVIYQEILGAVNAQLPVLTAIGLRALIEAICKEQIVIATNLEKRIDGLATNGVLSQAQAKILHGHRFLGNVAAHEIESAKPKELIAALEIAEAMLKTIYILPGLSNQIRTGK